MVVETWLETLSSEMKWRGTDGNEQKMTERCRQKGDGSRMYWVIRHPFASRYSGTTVYYAGKVPEIS